MNYAIWPSAFVALCDRRERKLDGVSIFSFYIILIIIVMENILRNNCNILSVTVFGPKAYIRSQIIMHTVFSKKKVRRMVYLRYLYTLFVNMLQVRNFAHKIEIKPNKKKQFRN